MMRFIIILFIWIPFISFAQDILIKKNGDEISSKVIEITEEYIKYKAFDFQDGPIRNIKVTEVFMILYGNGKREKFSSLENEISLNKASEVPLNNVSNKSIPSNNVGNSSFSKRLEVLKGDFKNIKNIKNYDVVFDYTNVMIPDYDSEEAFLKDKMSKREEKHAGSGEVFKKSWFNDRKTKYEPEFIRSFNKYARKKGITVSKNSGARYIIKIHTLIIYPGYNVGVWDSPSAIKAEISIYDIKNPNVLLLKALYGKSTGNSVYNAGDRIAHCYNSLAAWLYWDIKKRALK